MDVGTVDLVDEHVALNDDAMGARHTGAIPDGDDMGGESCAAQEVDGRHGLDLLEALGQEDIDVLSHS